jgi:hypothetical protein
MKRWYDRRTVRWAVNAAWVIFFLVSLRWFLSRGGFIGFLAWLAACTAFYFVFFGVVKAFKRLQRSK